jgi:putative restriction endonuclease
VPFNLKSIQFLLADALRAYSQDFRLLTNVNPYLLQLNGREYSVHASEIHDSGAGRTNADEWRIQLQSTIKRLQAERFARGITTLYVGFFPNTEVFSAWEPARIAALNVAGTGSVYIPHSDLGQVEAVGGALRTVRAAALGRNSSELSLPTSALGLYFENYAMFHNLSNFNELRVVLNASLPAASAESYVGTEVEEVVVAGARLRVTMTRTAFPRNSRFRDAVMRAYRGRCCVCDRQLGLVQAAHIIPHNHPDCQEHVSNGLALCIEHHRLYDDALLLPSARGVLYLNADRVEHLRNISQDSGIDAIRALGATNYRVPDHVPSRPNDAYLERGVRIRLGTDA